MWKKTITPCLWFDRQAEEAAHLYVSIFPESKITSVGRFPDAGEEIHGGKPGSVMAVSFELTGRPFTALNGGPLFRFNEAISLQVPCDSQDEIDFFWKKLSEGGDPEAQQCGWLKDRFGVSWQVFPAQLDDWLADTNRDKAARVMSVMLKMKKMDLETLRRAHEQ